jgi:hypothetical protein
MGRSRVEQERERRVVIDSDWNDDGSRFVNANGNFGWPRKEGFWCERCDGDESGRKQNATHWLLL